MPKRKISFIKQMLLIFTIAMGTVFITLPIRDVLQQTITPLAMVVIGMVLFVLGYIYVKKYKVVL